MTRTMLMLSIAFLCGTIFAPRADAKELDDQSEAPERKTRIQLMEAEFDVKMREIELAHSERAVEEAEIEIEKVEEHVMAAQRQAEPNPKALTRLEHGQARIRLEMQKLRSEMARLNLERAKARLQLKETAGNEKPEKRTRVQLEYVDDLDVVILRGPKEGVDKIRALIEKAEQEQAQQD